MMKPTLLQLEETVTNCLWFLHENGLLEEFIENYAMDEEVMNNILNWCEIEVNEDEDN